MYLNAKYAFAGALAAETGIIRSGKFGCLFYIV
jgi:hypothetical protein